MALRDFKKAVRIVSRADEAQVLGLCQECGIVDNQLTFAKNDEAGNHIFLVWFRTEIAANSMTTRNNSIILGGKPVTIELLANLPVSTQDQYKGVLRMYCEQSVSDRFITPQRRGSNKENTVPPVSSTQHNPSTISLTPTLDIRKKYNNVHTDRLHFERLHDLLKTDSDTSSMELMPGRLRSLSPTLSLENRTPRQGKFKRFSLSSSSPNPSYTTPLYLKRSFSSKLRSSSPWISHTPISNAFNSENSSKTSVPLRSCPKNVDRGSPEKNIEVNDSNNQSAVMRYVTIRHSSKIDKIKPQAPLLPTKFELLKEELEEAKEGYSTSLSKLKNQLLLMDTKYGNQS